MTRLTIVILAAALLGVAALSVAHAQPPAQLSPPAEPPSASTGSISGHIVFQGPQPAYVQYGVNWPYRFFLFPPGTPRPFDFRSPFAFLFAHVVSADAEGNFFFPALAAGDYFILPFGDLEEATLPLETVATITDDGPGTERAVRVTVGEGQAVTGIELVIRIPELQPVIPGEDCPQPLSPPNGLSPPSDLPFVCAPTTGAGPGGADYTFGYIAVGLAALAALLLAGGLALRARGRRVL